MYVSVLWHGMPHDIGILLVTVYPHSGPEYITLVIQAENAWRKPHDMPRKFSPKFLVYPVISGDLPQVTRDGFPKL